MTRACCQLWFRRYKDIIFKRWLVPIKVTKNKLLQSYHRSSNNLRTSRMMEDFRVCSWINITKRKSISLIVGSSRAQDEIKCNILIANLIWTQAPFRRRSTWALVRTTGQQEQDVRELALNLADPKRNQIWAANAVEEFSHLPVSSHNCINVKSVVLLENFKLL